MAKNGKTITKAEKERRKAQSSKDKKSTVRVQQSAPRVSQKPKKKSSATGTKIGSPYGKLVLDPCNAAIPQTSMPGQGGCTAVRLPFRQIVYMPTTTTDVRNGAITGGVSCDTLYACLTPHAMVAGTGPFVLTIATSANEQSLPPNYTSGSYNLNVDPPGLSAFDAQVGEMRPVAACVRIQCMDTDLKNSGQWYGYEGTNRQFLQHTGDDTTGYAPAVTAQNIMYNGKQVNDTFNAFEVRVNYPNADPEWQQFRQLTGTTSSATGVYRSGDASDPDWSEMPIAIAGVTSAIPGSKYLVDGAIVYEWMPKLTMGIAAPPKPATDSRILQDAAKKVQQVANGWGGMLISGVADYATGGSASVVTSLLKRAFLS